VLEGLIPRYDKSALHDASLLGEAGFSFFAGAVFGGLATRLMHDVALWFAVGLLLGALLRMGQLVRSSASA